VLNGLIRITFYMGIYIIFAFVIMEQSVFSELFSNALAAAAQSHGGFYPPEGARAWGMVGAAYLGFALGGLSSDQLRQKQYSARDNHGPVILNCKWYNALANDCLGGNDSIETLLPGNDGTLFPGTVSKELFLEMLDFCREG